jgi:TPR repeat protein
MSLFEQAKALGRAGRPQEAVRLIESAAEAGDPEGGFILAHWLLYGSDRPRDPEAACALLEGAADKGKADAMRVLAHITANGTGRAPDQGKALTLLERAASSDGVAAAELQMIPKLKADAEPQRERVSSDPHIAWGGVRPT